MCCLILNHSPTPSAGLESVEWVRVAAGWQVCLALLCDACGCGCRFLSDEGIEFLREYLNLPSEIVPATLKKSTRPLERGGP